MSFKLVNLLFSIYNGKTYNKVTARPYKLYLDMVEVIFLRFLVAAFYTTKVRHNVPIPQSIRAFQFRFQFQFQNRIWIRKYKKSNRKSKSSRILARLRYAMQMRLNYYAGPSTLSLEHGGTRGPSGKCQIETGSTDISNTVYTHSGDYNSIIQQLHAAIDGQTNGQRDELTVEPCLARPTEADRHKQIHLRLFLA